MAEELPLVSGLLWSTLVRSEAGTALSSSERCLELEGKEDGFHFSSQQPGTASPCPRVGPSSFAVVLVLSLPLYLFRLSVFHRLSLEFAYELTATLTGWYKIPSSLLELNVATVPSHWELS